MEQVEKKVTPTEVVIRMLSALNQDKIGEVYKIAADFSKSMGNRNQNYYRIARLVGDRPPEMRTLDQVSHQLKNLLIQGQGSVENVFLNKGIRDLLVELTLEWNNVDAFKFHNLKVRNKILLHGTTGNGKTTIARYIAQVSGKPFVEIKSEEVIDSHLGSTATNIHKVLNEIKQSCVLFWDEIDSIGCKRGTDVKSAAGHENDRMTNAILVNLDRLGDEVILIGATNRKDVLDSAFIRRFDVMFEVLPPTEEEKNMFATQCIHYFKLDLNNGWGHIVKQATDKAITYSDIVRELRGIARSQVFQQIRFKAETNV